MEYKQDSIETHIQQRFQQLQKIGSGAYGYVWKVRERKNGFVYALKKVFLAFQNDVDAQRTFREISILKGLDHPNIVKLKQVIKAENGLDLYLLFEYVECDLFNAIKDGALSETHRRYVIYQLCNALQYLHSAGVLHRDLKPSNILIDSECRVKICDFGLSRTLYHYNDEPPKMTEFIATRWYRAPEVLFGSTTYSYKSDMWSLGCLIYQMYAARPLLPGKDSVNQIQKLLEFKGFPTQQQIQALKVDRLQILLSHFQTTRLPENMYFRTNWNSKVIAMLKCLLEYDPNLRWGPKQLKNCDILTQFHKYDQCVQAKAPIIMKISDNTRCDKDYYRSYIHKTFISGKLNILDKTIFSKSLHRPSSSSLGKRNTATSLRKQPSKNSTVSLHHKLSTGKLSNTNRIYMRQSSKESKNIVKKPQKSFDKISKSENVSLYKERSKLNTRRQKENCPIPKKEAVRKLYKNMSRSILKEETTKKTLKRRALVYNI